MTRRQIISGIISFIIGLILLLSALFNQHLPLLGFNTIAYCLGGMFTMFGVLVLEEK